MPNDLENYCYVKMMGGALKVKQGVTPHKFACQSHGIASAQMLEKRSALQHKRSLKEMFDKNVDVMHQPGKNMNVLCLNFIYHLTFSVIGNKVTPPEVHVPIELVSADVHILLS